MLELCNEKKRKEGTAAVPLVHLMRASIAPKAKRAC